MATEPELEAARGHVQDHIRKTVGISALRKIRGLVDDYEEERRQARRFTPIGIGLICLAVVAVLLSLFVFRFAPAARPSAPVSQRDVVTDSAQLPLRVGAVERPNESVPGEYSEKFRTRVESAGAKTSLKSQGLSGAVTLATHVRTDDGTVARIEVVKPSGTRELDDAAQKVVMMASPFPPPPDDLKKKTATLVITRTFTFTKD